METLVWYLTNALEYAVQMAPCCALGLLAFGLALPFRRRRLAAMGLESGQAREAALLLFTLFCCGLGALTLFPDRFWTPEHWSGWLAGLHPLFPPVDRQHMLDRVQLDIFGEIGRAGTSRWLMFMMIANLGVFLPVGFFPAVLWRGWRLWKSALAGFGTSLVIETVQLLLPRTSDVDDLILNTAGAAAGYLLAFLFRRLFPGPAARLQVRRLPAGPEKLQESEENTIG